MGMFVVGAVDSISLRCFVHFFFKSCSNDIVMGNCAVKNVKNRNTKISFVESCLQLEIFSKSGFSPFSGCYFTPNPSFSQFSAQKIYTKASAASVFSPSYLTNLKYCFSL